MRALKFLQAACAIGSLAVAEYVIVSWGIDAQAGYVSGRMGFPSAAVVSFCLVVLAVQTPDVIAAVIYGKGQRAAAIEAVNDSTLT